ncbi:MAG: 50S ribosomal protein L2 [bacterium]|nr:50S ribosomal protein L2 [bacterium]
MAKHYKPYTASRRHMTGYDFSGLSKVEPLKKLTAGFKRSVGRNNQGRITTRHKGGGVKRLYRAVDFNQNKLNILAKVATIEYDPNRSARIARLHYADGEKRYILAPDNLKVGDAVVVGEKTAIKIGNRMKLKNILQGTMVHNIEISPGRGGQLAKSAGAGAMVMAKEGNHVQIQLPSGELRMFNGEAMASVGQLSNIEHNTIVIGKAGRSRWMGRRPAVRGSAMNPVDHPHGGGEGRQGIGLKYPKTPWGKHALGVKTRDKKKKSSKFIIRRRKKKARK